MREKGFEIEKLSENTKTESRRKFSSGQNENFLLPAKSGCVIEDVFVQRIPLSLIYLPRNIPH